MSPEKKSTKLISLFRTISSDGIDLFHLRDLLAHRKTKTCFVERVEEKSEYFFFDPIVSLKIDSGTLSCTDSTGTREIPGNPMQQLRKHLGSYSHEGNSPQFACGFVGYIGYDCVRYLEAIELPLKRVPEPDACLFLFGTALVLNQAEETLTVVVNGCPEEDGHAREALKERLESVIRLIVPLSAQSGTSHEIPAEKFKGIPVAVPDHAPESFSNAVGRIREHIRKGDVFQCVLSQKFEIDAEVSSIDLYRNLRAMNPSPYHYCLSVEDFDLVGASPEPFLRVNGQLAATYPIAGTRPRGATLEEDKRYETQLRRSRKEKAEHVMLVDLSRNDLGRVCLPGTIRVEEFMQTKRFSHVMHLVSTVTGKLKPNQSSVDALLACFPAGTLTGAPKIRAMEIISQLEPMRRGIYGGVFVLADFSGNLDSCITIRSAIVRSERTTFQAGAGIVADSQVQREYREIFSKSLAVRRAVSVGTASGKRKSA